MLFPMVEKTMMMMMMMQHRAGCGTTTATTASTTTTATKAQDCTQTHVQRPRDHNKGCACVFVPRWPQLSQTFSLRGEAIVMSYRFGNSRHQGSRSRDEFRTLNKKITGFWENRFRNTWSTITEYLQSVEVVQGRDLLRTSEKPVRSRNTCFL